MTSSVPPIEMYVCCVSASTSFLHRNLQIFIERSKAKGKVIFLLKERNIFYIRSKIRVLIKHTHTHIYIYICISYVIGPCIIVIVEE